MFGAYVEEMAQLREDQGHGAGIKDQGSGSLDGIVFK